MYAFAETKFRVAGRADRENCCLFHNDSPDLYITMPVAKLGSLLGDEVGLEMKTDATAGLFPVRQSFHLARALTGRFTSLS